MDPELDPLLGEKKNPRDQQPEENPYRRIALTLICMVAAGCVLVGGMNVIAYWLKCRHDKLAISIGHCLYLAVPLLIGVALLAASPALSRRIEQMLDD